MNIRGRPSMTRPEAARTPSSEGDREEVSVDATSRPALEADSEELNLDWTCSATRCRPRASLPTDAGYGPRGEARADARDCLYCGWARRALSVRDTGH